jgi:hypothetical protein
VCVMDGGIHTTPLQRDSYDTHWGDHLMATSSGVFNLCSALAEQIWDPTTSTSPDPNKLDLADTMIVINTEFGRNPLPDSFYGGRDHWPHGYPAILIGGRPHLSTNLPAIVGGIDSTGGAIGPGGAPALSPSDVHAAVLLAAGIDPLAVENFGHGDFTTTITDGYTATDHQIRLNLKTTILGMP